MNRTATLIAITLLSAIATPVVVNATTPKASAMVAPAAVAALKAEAPAYARTIRVVYAGYGEPRWRPAPCSAAKGTVLEIACAARWHPALSGSMRG